MIDLEPSLKSFFSRIESFSFFSIFDRETFVSECFVNSYCKGYYTFNTDGPPNMNVYLSLNQIELSQNI